ncbi:MAG: polyphosphate polymerase domain-containing protein [Agathobacter sp.]|nr:polyphosphate polymerase domain-containing protein [Agathobacter sp.]
MKYRHEWKHEINYCDLLVLRSRLSAVMQTDVNAVNGQYLVRSIYFDTPTDKALREKIDGVNCREKYRIRLYNKDISQISLEKKSKINGLCAKESCPISYDEAKLLLEGKLEWMKDMSRPLCQELYRKMQYQGLKPKTIVDYTREPFVYPAGNVRVTIDYNIRTGMYSTDFLNAEVSTLPAGEAPIILEVKCDEYLPDIIKDAVNIQSRRSSAFSKYAQCRIYG